MTRNAGKGLIFDIQGHSIHDGPGTRTLVFLSGCPLRCRWCSNPEGMLLRQRLMYRPRLCKNCPARCVPACPHDAARVSENGEAPMVFGHAACDTCGSMPCTGVCYTGALQLSGKWYSVEELMRVFQRDRGYWGEEGGITLTGGEPLMQEEFVLQLLERCHDAMIATCVETSGQVPRTMLQAALPLIQWLFVDLKHMDSGKHLEATGVPNGMILDNIRWIAASDWPGRMVLRMPVIPGFNDSVANAEATAKLLMDIGSSEINLLPFHRMGASKYEQLGMPYTYAEQSAVPQETMEALARVYGDRNIACHIGADTPF